MENIINKVVNIFKSKNVTFKEEITYQDLDYVVSDVKLRNVSLVTILELQLMDAKGMIGELLNKVNNVNNESSDLNGIKEKLDKMFVTCCDLQVLYNSIDDDIKDLDRLNDAIKNEFSKFELKYIPDQVYFEFNKLGKAINELTEETNKATNKFIGNTISLFKAITQ